MHTLLPDSLWILLYSAAAVYCGRDLYRACREKWPGWKQMVPSEQSKIVQEQVANVCFAALVGVIIVSGGTELMKIFKETCTTPDCGHPWQVVGSLIFNAWPWCGSAIIGFMVATSREAAFHFKSYVLSAVLAWVGMLFFATVAFLDERNSSGTQIPGLVIGAAWILEFIVLILLFHWTLDIASDYKEGFEDLERAREKLIRAEREIETKKEYMNSLAVPLDVTWWKSEQLWWASWASEGVRIARSSAALEIARKVYGEGSTLSTEEAIWRPRSEWRNDGKARMEKSEHFGIEAQVPGLDEKVSTLLNQYIVRERRSFSSAAFEIGLVEAHLAQSIAEFAWEQTDTGKGFARKQRKHWKKWWQDQSIKRSLEENEIRAQAELEESEIRAQAEKAEAWKRATHLSELFVRGSRVPIAAKYWIRLVVGILIYLAAVLWSKKH